MIYNLNLRLYTKEGEQADYLFVTAKSPKGQTDFWCTDSEASKDIYNVMIKRMAEFINDHESEIHENFKTGKVEPVKEKINQQCKDVERVRTPVELNVCNCFVSDDSSTSMIEDWDLSFYLGNVVKYISRAGRKDNAIEDLEKAQQYLNWEIDRLKAREQK